MTKRQFLNELRDRLEGLPKEDIDSRISFYEEAIDDRIDDGLEEEEAVEDIGTIDEVVNDILRDTPLRKIVKEKVRPKRALRAWEIVLIVLGFPLWFPLVLTALILALVGYLLIWVWVLVTYSVELSLVVAAVGELILFFINLAAGNAPFAHLGMSIMCAGGSMLLIFGCIGATKTTIKLSAKIVTAIKKAFIKKGSK